jgi:acyl-CoA reductase-like NAD-dependent aldehyde dehydrogenase
MTDLEAYEAALGRQRTARAALAATRLYDARYGTRHAEWRSWRERQPFGVVVDFAPATAPRQDVALRAE